MRILKNYFILLMLVLPGFLIAQAPNGIVKGKIIDRETKETIPLANIILRSDSNVIKNGTVADFDGNYIIKNVQPGTYHMEVSFAGYAKRTITNIILFHDSTLIKNIELTEDAQQLEEVVLLYSAPQIDKAKTSRVTNAEDIVHLVQPNRDVNGSIQIRGARPEGTVYFVDGYKMRGSHPSNAIIQNTESYESLPENEFLSPIEKPLSTFSSDVDVAAYANMRRFIMDGQLPPKDAVRFEEMLNYFNYNYPNPEKGKSFSVNTQLGECPWAKGHQVLQIGINTEKLEIENIPAANLVFLIDVSGSMGSDDKLPLLQKSLKMMVNNLRKKDNVAIVVYAGSSGLVLPSTSGDEKEKINKAIENLRSGGSTAGAAGIELAYKVALKNFKSKGVNRVILATDGDFNVGISDNNDLVKLIEKKRDDGVSLSVLGFGTGNYQDSKMEKLADNGNGNYAYIDNLLEAKKVLVNELGSTLNTIAKDTKFQIEFNPSQVQAYRLLGYENRVLQDEDFNNDAKDAGDIGSGHSVTVLYEIIPVGVEIDKDFKIGKDIDPLKYQKTKTDQKIDDSQELATLKIRHKRPGKIKSELETLIIDSKLDETNTDFNFMLSVAQLAMILKNSDYKGDSNFDNLLLLAKKGKGSDEMGYRAEYIRIAALAEELYSEEASKR